MALTEDVIFTDPVLQRIFFDQRRFAPRATQEAAVTNLEYDITDAKLQFSKAKRLQELEPMQIGMRRRWFEIRTRCDGYLMKLPAGYDDGCEHVTVFAHDNLDPCFRIDVRKRYALWRRYAQRVPPRGLHGFTPRL